MDLSDAERKLHDLRDGCTPLNRNLKPVGVIPVHVGGLMMDMDTVQAFADRHGFWLIEDASQALPAAYRRPANEWRRCGENTSLAAWFSFSVEETVTTGEGRDGRDRRRGNRRANATNVAVWILAL